MRKLTLYAGFLLSTSHLTPFAVRPEAPDLRAQYGQIAQNLKIKNPKLELRFVVGRADPKFVAVPPTLWDPSGTYDVFSEKDAFGRFFCAKHPRNKTGKPLLVVRADEPGDTLAHEYLHFLQSQANPKLCELWNRLETQATEEDLKQNDLVEYEVVRFLYENAESLKFSPEIKAGLIEKLIASIKKHASDLSSLDIPYGWQPLSSNALDKEVAQIVAEYQKSLQNRVEYALPQKTGIGLPSRGSVKINEGISVIPSLKPDRAQLPYCVEAEGVPPNQKGFLDSAIKQWNEALPSLGKPIFSTNCETPRVKIVWSDTAGKAADGAIRIAEVFDIKEAAPSQVILIRGLELKSFEWMLDAMIHTALVKIQDAKLRSVKQKRLAEFKGSQLQTRVKQVFLHELGHTLGLGHNFRPENKSVMDYAENTQLSDYDRAAIGFVLTGKLPEGQTWNASFTLPQEHGLTD